MLPHRAAGLKIKACKPPSIISSHVAFHLLSLWLFFQSLKVNLLGRKTVVKDNNGTQVSKCLNAKLYARFFPFVVI